MDRFKRTYVCNNDLEKSLDVLLCDLLNLKKNEKLLICCDQGSDEKVTEAAVIIGERIGATTTVKKRDSLRILKEEPDLNLTLAMRNADVICDFSERYLFYTTAWKKALETGARGYCLGNISSKAMIRCIGKVDINEINTLGRMLAKKTRKGNIIKITSKSGTDLTLRMNKLGAKLSAFLAQRFRIFRSMSGKVGDPTGLCHKSGQSTFLSGQVNFIGIKRSINGILVFDGSVCPPFELGVLRSPIFCKVKHGKIIDIFGNQEATIFKEWLKNFNQVSMFDIVHFSYGFNPGAKLSGHISEDERVYGCIVVGIGGYPSHADGIIMKPTIQIDKDIIEKDGKYQFSY
jgi:leucyl aminopeptidase (aminopeptidase T)